MGGIWLQRIELLSALSEHAGSKAGLALNVRQLRQHLPDQKEMLNGFGAQLLRIRSEELAMMGAELLHAVGNTPTPDPTFWPPADLIPLLRDDAVVADLHEAMIEILKVQLEASHPGPLDAHAFIDCMREEHGTEGLRMAVRFIQTFQQQQHESIFAQFRRVEWADVLQLKDLFESEDIKTLYGQFLDQRFLDYLARNEHAMDSMNWRKFEGLAAEYFERSGYRVLLSKGRNDDNVDLRVWTRESRGAPLLLVQCKRQKAKVGKVVVKALYADVLHEKAAGGLVVTSSSLSPGAERTSVARAYPIGQANRTELRKWLQAMQSPGAGVFMGT
ncbi:MAG: restriction endonuclease [bacterium]|nr:restriction endonuclease [bacterium]